MRPSNKPRQKGVPITAAGSGVEMSEELTKCLLCGAEQLDPDSYSAWILNLVAPHGVSRCRRCGFRFLNPRPTAYEYQQAYAHGAGPLVEIYGFVGNFYEQESINRIAQYRKKLDILVEAGAKGCLLEIGACTGLFLNEARNRGFEVEGVEPNEQDCRTAHARYGLRLYVQRVEEADFPEGYFDVVFSSHVFEHLLDPLAVAKKVSKWLRPGGLHMLEVPNQFEAVSRRLRRLLRIARPRKRSFCSIHHPVFFSSKTLRLLAELSHCRVLAMRTVYYNSSSPLQNPKGALARLLAVFGGGNNIEILAQKG